MEELGGRKSEDKVTVGCVPFAVIRSLIMNGSFREILSKISYLPHSSQHPQGKGEKRNLDYADIPKSCLQSVSQRL